MAMVCMTTLVSYAVISVLFYRHVESFTAFRAFYFCVITFTTIGYGDFKPSSDLSKIFTCLFVFCGLAIIVSAIAWLLEYLMEERERHRLINIHSNFDVEDNIHTVLDRMSVHDDLDFHLASIPAIPTYAKNVMSNIATSTMKILAIVACGTIGYMCIFDQHSLIDSLYLSCMTISTVGYGDIQPSNDYSRGFTIVYALVGTTLTATALSSYTNALATLQQAKIQEEELSASLTIDSLSIMDADLNNVVSKEEFVLYKLKVMGLVDDSIIRRAEEQFERLDVTGSGSLTIDDIVEFQNNVNAARSKLLERNTD